MVDHVSRLFAEVPDRFHYQEVIFDGEFPTVDVPTIFSSKTSSFFRPLSRAGDLKQIMKNAADTPEAKAKRFWIRTCITNKQNEDAFLK